MNLRKITLFVLLIFVVLILGFFYVSFIFDPEVLISSIVSILEKEYSLKVEYKFVGKNLFSLLRGIEFNDVTVHSKNKKKLISSKNVYINVNLLSLFSSPKISSIDVLFSDVDLENTIQYLSSKEGQKIFSESSEGKDKKVILDFIKFKDITFYYIGKKFNLKYLDIGLNNFNVKGYLVNTKSKFFFDGTNFSIDNLHGNDILMNVNLSRVQGKIIDGKVFSYVNSVSYSNFLVFENVYIEGDLGKLNFGFNVSNAIFSINKDSFKVRNLCVFVNIKDNVKGSFKLFDNVVGEFYVAGDTINGRLKIKNFSKKDLDVEVFSKISNLVENFVTQGEVNFKVGPKIVSILGNVRLNVSTTMKSSLFKNVDLNFVFQGRSVNVSIYSKTTKSDVKIEGFISFEDVFEINNVFITSKRLDISEILDYTLETNSSFSSVNGMPINVSNASFEIRIGEIVLGDDIPKIGNMFITGILNLYGGKLYAYIENVYFKIVELNFKARGNVEYVDRLRVKLNFLPFEFSLFSLYSGLILSSMGGKVYGNGFLKNLEFILDDYLYVRGSVQVSNVEVIDIKIQDKLTRILNLDLGHIFVDEGNFEFEIVTNNVRGNGNISGDVNSKFNFKWDGKKLFLGFDYFNVSRSIIENVPKVFFIRNEINGIKYILKDDYLNFEKFEIEIF